MSDPLQQADEISLAERAYRELRDRLIMLDIRPGAPVNDEQLAAELGVGRTPVREALKRLETERLVVAYPRRGTFATEVNITDLSHIAEVRRSLEPLAAAGAAHRATTADREQMSNLHAQLRRQRGPRTEHPQLMHLDMQVHRAIYAAAHNPYLEDTLIRYDNLATRIWCLFTDRLPELAEHVAEHTTILKAIAAGDAEQAAALAGQHVTHFEQAIRAIL